MTKCALTPYTARADMTALLDQFLFSNGTIEQTVPIGDHRQQRGDLDQVVIAARQVRPRATPTPLVRAARQLRPHGIPFHVPRRRQQIRLIHDEGSESALPQIAAPLLAEIDTPRVASMRLADRPPQAVLGFRDRDQMDVIGQSGNSSKSRPLPRGKSRP